MTLPCGPSWAAGHLAAKSPLLAAVCGGIIGFAYFTETQTGPTVAITFDDGYEAVYTKAKPILEENGFVATAFINSNSIGRRNYLNREELRNLSYTWEIGGHSRTHADLTTLKNDELIQEVRADKERITQYVQSPIFTFASPFGKYDANTLGIIGQYYDYHVNAFSTAKGINTAATPDLEINRMTFGDVYEVADVCEAVYNLEDDELFVVAFHNVTDEDTDNKYDVTTSELRKIMACLKEAGVEVKTLTRALDELKEQ